MDQPMIFRVKTAITAAQYSLPSPVGCSVMSVSHRASGQSAGAPDQVLLGGGVHQVLPGRGCGRCPGSRPGA
jgi:hypothetical protein